MVTDIISPFLFWFAIIIKYPEMREFPKIILDPIGYVIVLFASLIYNEIIIFNFCKLNKKNKIFIIERLNEESKELKKTETELKTGTFNSYDDDSTINEEDK